MGRRWNRLKSAVYTRLHWLSELYGRLQGGGRAEIPLPSLATSRKPPAERRVALLTSAGVHHRHQVPFDMADPNGDASYRVIAGDAALDELTITHDYYDHAAADRDLNCVFPLERLRELVAGGGVGQVAPRHVGMMGHILGGQRVRLVRDTAPGVAQLFADDAVDLVLATPG